MLCGQPYRGLFMSLSGLYHYFPLPAFSFLLSASHPHHWFVALASCDLGCWSAADAPEILPTITHQCIGIVCARRYRYKHKLYRLNDRHHCQLRIGIFNRRIPTKKMPG